MVITIKAMETAEEIEGKSRVHWQTWREAYDEILPAEFQEQMTLDKCRFYSQKYYYGKGVGQQLIQAAFAALDGYQEIVLWVLEDNKRAIAFYEKMGFVFDGQEKVIDLGKAVKEKRMIYVRNSNS